MKFIYHRAKNYDNLQKYVLGYYLKYSLRNRKSTIIRLTWKTYNLFNYLIGHNFRVYIIQWSINCTNNALKPVLKTFIQMCNYPLNLFDQACAPLGKERFWMHTMILSDILDCLIKSSWLATVKKKIKWNEMRSWHAYSHTCFIIRLIDCIPKVI